MTASEASIPGWSSTVNNNLFTKNQNSGKRSKLTAQQQINSRTEEGASVRSDMFTRVPLCKLWGDSNQWKEPEGGNSYDVRYNTYTDRIYYQFTAHGVLRIKTQVACQIYLEESCMFHPRYLNDTNMGWSIAAFLQWYSCWSLQIQYPIQLYL